MAGERKAKGKREERRAMGRQRNAALFPSVLPRANLPRDYLSVLNEIKHRIRLGLKGFSPRNLEYMQVYARCRGGVAGAENCAAVCCTNTVVSQLRAS